MSWKSPGKPVRSRWLAPVLVVLCLAQPLHAAFTTTVPVSEQLAGDLAESSFPLALALDDLKLLLTQPDVLFMGPLRIGLRVSFQAYDHRPDEGIAVSETGQAMVSGRVAFDAASREVLLHDPLLEQLVFDRDTALTRQLSGQLQAAWSERIGNPMRSELPPHPYLQPFKANIADFRYDGSHISLVLTY